MPCQFNWIEYGASNAGIGVRVLNGVLNNMTNIYICTHGYYKKECVTIYKTISKGRYKGQLVRIYESEPLQKYELKNLVTYIKQLFNFTKNEALLELKNENKFVRCICKKIIKGDTFNTKVLPVPNSKINTFIKLFEVRT